MLIFLSPPYMGLIGWKQLRGIMTKLDTELQALPISYASQPDLGTARRLIVPVTSPEADLTIVTQRGRELANASRAHINFIGLCDSTIQEPALRRTLIWLGSLFLGISYLAKEVGVTPAESATVISQLARTVFAGRHMNRSWSFSVNSKSPSHNTRNRWRISSIGFLG